MSEENVELVRRVDDVFIAGFERGDFAAPFETGAVSEDHELVAAPAFTERRSFRGREGFVGLQRRLTEDFDQYSIRREELIDAGDDRVFGAFRMTAIGKGSGAPVELKYFMVWELERRQLVLTRIYLDHAEALEAAGLSE